MIGLQPVITIPLPVDGGMEPLEITDHVAINVGRSHAGRTFQKFQLEAHDET